MTIDEAIKHFEQYIDNACYTEKHQRACEMAITALRAQQTPAKLVRSRWEGCKLCNEPTLAGFTTYCGYRYCKNCGRPLTEEAWAELERRINDGTADVEKRD